jgi:F420-non-reducing hydrogenase iron-sulfur subunit
MKQSNKTTIRQSDDKTNGFEPKIVAFCCNWCSYPAADGAGVSRLQYPTNIKIVRVMCGGRVTPSFVLKAFELGADGVLVATCHFEDCHYMFGARRAADVHKITEQLTNMLGIEKQRLKLDWISSAEASKFARVANEFTETIRKLGPSRIRKKKFDALTESTINE